MNFTNPTHLDYIIFTNVTNLVYLKTDKLKFTSAKIHNIFHIHKNINNFITPQHKKVGTQRAAFTQQSDKKVE